MSMRMKTLGALLVGLAGVGWATQAQFLDANQAMAMHTAVGRGPFHPY